MPPVRPISQGCWWRVRSSTSSSLTCKTGLVGYFIFLFLWKKALKWHLVSKMSDPKALYGRFLSICDKIFPDCACVPVCVCACEATGPVGQVTGHDSWSERSSLKACAAMTLLPHPTLCLRSLWVAWTDVLQEPSSCRERRCSTRSVTRSALQELSGIVLVVYVCMHICWCELVCKFGLPVCGHAGGSGYEDDEMTPRPRPHVPGLLADHSHFLLRELFAAL